ncbi:GNAT family N-acetyltransferase [Sabulibacter ruber]|uniref:GNAT family N-acetyltransferase n=1 Tax=Sabulibacter ruber TaxID=2811901 RepID=UPI001A957011|nr:GNAT family N-acetyltransferase [Sabulibacter ruber]
MDLTIINNEAAHRFETTVEGITAFIDYKLRPGVMWVLHTEVPQALEGRGIAGAMSKHVLEYIIAQKLQIVPLCPYMAAYLKRHPEYQYLVKPDASLRLKKV